MGVIRYEVFGRVAVVTIDRPAARNAINGEVACGIEEAVDRMESDATIWVGVLTGSPPVFSAGADLKAVSAGGGPKLYTERGGFAGLVRRQRTKPLIAAVDGPALAGGTELVLACDLVVASENAQFGLPEVRRSLVASGGALFRLPRKIPVNLAMECALTGEPISAVRAHHFGLVNELCAPGATMERALELAGRICRNAPLAVRETRMALHDLAAGDETEGWERSEGAIARVNQTADFREGVAAFVEKRPPEWSGS